MMIGQYLTNLNKNMNTMNTYNRQLASNRRITKLSDDPVGVISTLDIRAKIRNIDQYKRNVDDTRAWLIHAETALMDINESVKSAYEHGLQAANGTQTDEEKSAIATYLRQLKEHVFQTGNSTYGNKHLFGGYNTDSAPFTMDGDEVKYNGNYNLANLDSAIPADKTTIDNLNQNQINYEIGKNLFMKVSFTGAEVMGTGESNLFAMFDKMINLLENGGSTEDIAAETQKFKNKQNDVLSLLADIGGRSNRLEMVSERYELDAMNYEMVRANIEDIDQSEVIMKFKMAEAVYNAALSVGSRVIVPSLVDFLR